jgi:hypothetical protein
MEDDLKRLEEIFGKISRAESTYEVRASAKHYPSLTKVFVPNTPYQKKIPFLDDAEDERAENWTNRATVTLKTSNEDNLDRSLRNTKTTVADYALCNEFNIFATFTFSPEKSDRLNPNAVKMQMANWLRNQRKRFGRFGYLIVPELHKDRRALHFHALMKDYSGILTFSGRNHKGRPIYHFKSYTLGFNSAVPIDNIQKVSSYLRKYITKDMPQFHNKHRFWTSNGLSRPRVEDNPADWYLRETPLQTYVTEYGVVLYFPPRKEKSDEE